MVDRSKMTDKECVESLADCLRIVRDTEESLKLYKQVLQSSQIEFMKRFSNTKVVDIF